MVRKFKDNTDFKKILSGVIFTGNSISIIAISMTDNTVLIKI